MTAVKDKAVCIGRRNYSETSQIVTLFSRGRGKIKALAKGSRRERGKFGGGIDVLAEGEILFVPPHGEAALAILAEFDLQESFANLRQDLPSLPCAEYMSYLIGEFTEEFDPHEKLYDAFVSALKQLGPQYQPELTLLNFELTLLREIGLSPVWQRCGSCGGPLVSDQNLYFSSGNGGMLCRDCEPAVVEKRPVNPQVLQILQHPETAETATRKTTFEAHELLSYYQQELAGKQAVVMKFVNRILSKRVNE
ncbi:MAG: DNA repair protein RecO [Sedimentisphaerales bacterium]|nr:DNA repair protein RecO [Sedimentisphaerales bacterium]